jgi:uncharacterized protein
MESVTRREFMSTVGMSIAAGGLAGLPLEQAMAQPIEALAEKMPRRVLGHMGWKTPAIGLGTMFHRSMWENGHASTISPQQSERLLNTALDLGVNCWETGRAYSNAEAMLGQVLTKRRDEVFMADKSHKLKAGKEGVLRDLEISLSNLKTDYIDCFSLHNCSSENELNMAMAPNGAYEGLVQAKKEGKTRFIGMTSHSCRAWMKAMRQDLFDMYVIPHNSMSREFERGLKLARKKNVVVWNMKPFGCGDTGVGLLNYDSSDRGQLPEVMKDEECLRFVLSNPGVTIAIPGSSTLAYLKRNIAIAATFKPLSTKERADVTARADRIKTGVCGLCEKPCEFACPNEVPISFILSKKQMDSRFMYDTRQNSDYYSGMDHDYMDCDGCGECEAVCEQKFEIRKDMATAHQRLSELRAIKMTH